MKSFVSERFAYEAGKHGEQVLDEPEWTFRPDPVRVGLSNRRAIH